MFRFYHCLLLVLFVYALGVQGVIIRGSLKTSTGTDASNNIIKTQYCEYSNERYSVGQKWTLDAPKCLHCECSLSGLYCRGYGVRAGMIIPPPGYKLATDKCEIEYIKI